MRGKDVLVDQSSSSGGSNTDFLPRLAIQSAASLVAAIGSFIAGCIP
jgi:hypothetical protein